MASVKLATLAIRTIAKPISEQLRTYARSNQRFRTFCISLAQTLWKAEIRLRETILGEVHGAVKPLNDAKAIQNGSNFLAEGFLFSVAAALIIAETWRSSRSQNKRKEGVDDRIDELETRVGNLVALMEAMGEQMESIRKDMQVENARNEEISRVLLKVVDIGITGGWAEFKDRPIQLPPMQLDRLKGLPSSGAETSSLDSDTRLRNLSAVVEQYERIKSSRDGSLIDTPKRVDSFTDTPESVKK